MMAHICNSSYSGDRNKDNHGLRPAGAKELVISYLNQYLWMVVHACHSTYVGNIDWWIMVLASPSMNADPMPKIGKRKRIGM
jgi:hypothetical protein